MNRQLNNGFFKYRKYVQINSIRCGFQMPFKIVQTKEKNHILLSIVPEGWESDNKLRWPNSGQVKKAEFNSMLRDENCAPRDNWLEVKCRVKRLCKTYDEAVAQSKVMSDQSDTDASDSMPPPSVPAKRKSVNRMTIARTPATDFNDVVSNFIF